MKSGNTILLVGDNPFQGISHLSQQRSIERGIAPTIPATAADVVMTALENGADGFTFSVSDLTLSILHVIREKRGFDNLSLYAMVPYAFEYVRLATQVGTPGLAKRFAKQIFLSRNIGAIALGVKAVATMNPSSLLRTYLTYEISRVRESAGKGANLVSVILNETITDMGLGLGMQWLFETYVDFMLEHKIKPGFNTRNFPSLISKFSEWHLNPSHILIVAPFNKVGFQMNPSKTECEKALTCSSDYNIMAISILAAGYLQLAEAVDYIIGLPNISSVAVGASKESQARETFMLLRRKFN